jgi:SAM-dependent methyltransferase
MIESKAWDWKNETNKMWLEPCEESYFLAHRWKQKGYSEILDLGCGLDRHSIFFAKNGFSVKAFDLSAEGVEYLNKWAKQDNLKIETKISDMLNLPYANDAFDCVFAYHVISHTDTKGIKKIIGEIERVLKPKGEFYLTLCSKDTWLLKSYPKIDENTVLKTDDGPEKGVPHFHVNLDDVLALFKDFKIYNIRHIDDCYSEGNKQSYKHYYILGEKK